MAKNIQGAAPGAPNSFLASSTSVTAVNGVIADSQEVQHCFIGIRQDDGFQQVGVPGYPLHVASSVASYRQYLFQQTLYDFILQSREYLCRTLRVFYQQTADSNAGSLNLELTTFSPAITLEMVQFEATDSAYVGKWAFFDFYLDPNITAIVSGSASLNLHIVAF